MTDIENIKKRLYSVLPTASLQMFEFLKLLNIRFSDEVTSAAVTCSVRPELLLNRAFIEEYCQTDEHLFMLVMHELYHVILGHTKLFARHSIIDNIAFDAVINALLCRHFPEEQYISFFTNINSDKAFPGALLRPKGKNTPKVFIPILKNLYCSETGTYFEVYQSIIQNMEKNGLSNQYVLLGEHSDDEDISNPLLKRMVEDLVEKWPKKMTTEGRDLGGELKNKTIELGKAKKKSFNQMKRLLLKAGVFNGIITNKKPATNIVYYSGLSFIPNYKDRTLLTKQTLGMNSCLYNKEYQSINRVSDSNIYTLVYLDVSGSVVEYIKEMMPLLKLPYKNKECKLYEFSTQVEEISYKDFVNGNYKTTGGTSIDCIFKHYFSLDKKYQCKKILILTDGYVGSINGSYKEEIKEKNIELYFGLFGHSNRRNIEEIAKCIEDFKEI